MDLLWPEVTATLQGLDAHFGELLLFWEAEWDTSVKPVWYLIKQSGAIKRGTKACCPSLLMRSS